MTVAQENTSPENTNQENKILETKEIPPVETKEETPSSEDLNWKAFREARKKDRLEKEEALRKAAEKEAEVAALKAAMEAAFSKSAPTPQAYQQYYGIQQENEETEDQRLEKKLNALLASREEQARKEAYQREIQEYPNRLKRDFPDFGHVVSQENLDYLDYHYPEISRPLQRLQEGYDKWHDIYHAVKKLIPNNSSMKKDAMKAEMNQQKPKSISTSTITQTGQAKETWQDVEQKRAANWDRMKKLMNGIG